MAVAKARRLLRVALNFRFAEGAGIVVPVIQLGRRGREQSDPSAELSFRAGRASDRFRYFDDHNSGQNCQIHLKFSPKVAAKRVLQLLLISQQRTMHF